MAGEGTPPTLRPAAPLPTRRCLAAIWAITVVCVVAALALASPWFALVPYVDDHQPMWPSHTGVLTMIGSASPGGIDVPNCALLSVTWNDLDGHAIGFGSYEGGPARLTSSCPDLTVPLAPESPPNQCPPWYCNRTGPIIDAVEGTYQVGTHGSFRFVDTQGAVGFWANVAGTNASSPDSVGIAYSYSVPVLAALSAPPGSEPPVPSLAWALLVPFVIALWAAAVAVLARRGRPPRGAPKARSS